MEEYTTNDLYVSAFLRAKWHECKIKSSGYRRFSFIFKNDVKEDADNFITKAYDFNVNASKMINEIKALKSYIANNT